MSAQTSIPPIPNPQPTKPKKKKQVEKDWLTIYRDNNYKDN